MGLHPDAIDALFRALAVGELLESLQDAFAFEVDGDGAAGFGHAEPLGQAVDRDHLVGAEQNGAADRHLSDGTAAPDRDRIGRLDVALHGRLPAGREDVAEKQHLLVGNAVGDLDAGGIGKRHAQVLGLAAGIAAGQMGVAEQAGRRVSEHLVGEMTLAVGGLADREIAALALVAFAANDREGNDDAVALLQLAVDAGADLDHFAHGLVAHDVAGQHARDEIVEEVQVRTADGAARDLDDGIARVLDFRIGDGVAADVFLAVPNQRLHLCSSRERSRGIQVGIQVEQRTMVAIARCKNLCVAPRAPRNRNERPTRRLERHHHQD